MKPDFGIAGRLSLKRVGSSWDRRHHIVPAGVSHGFADPGKRRRLRRLLSSYLEMDIHRVYEPFFRYFRTKRMRTFVGRFGVTEETRILDVGGSSFNWTLIDVKPRVVLLNLDQGDVIGDGTRLPFLDGSFDIVFSNSVIEHLRNRDAQMQFASEVRRVGKCFFVQTPHRYFPIEPHYLTPLIHSSRGDSGCGQFGSLFGVCSRSLRAKTANEWWTRLCCLTVGRWRRCSGPRSGLNGSWDCPRH